MASKKISELNETINIKNEDYIMIVQDGSNKKAKAQYLRGADTLKEEYVQLVGDDGKTYRVQVNNGQVLANNILVDDATPPGEGDNVLYDGLIINKMYGAGSIDTIENTPLTHSFIELYNLRKNSVNLKGVYLWYKTLRGEWLSLELRGIIPPQHSFLIRCSKKNDYTNDAIRYNVKDYDMEWDIPLSSKGFTAYLKIGAEKPDDAPIRERKDELGVVTYTNGYFIDMLGCGGALADENVSASEGRWLNCMTKDIGVMREDFANAGDINIGSNKKVKKNNEADCLPLDYSTCDINIYRPRSLKDGVWSVYVDKLQLKNSYPNLVNICYGENGNTTRTFTWQSNVTDEGEIRYRKVGEIDWIKKESKKRIVTHKDSDATIHSLIINNLTNGTYEYQLGEPGAWSDIETFIVQTHTNDNPIEVLVTSDEQGWTNNEFKSTRTAAKFIQNNESFDFHLNLGDISQNAIRSNI